MKNNDKNPRIPAVIYYIALGIMMTAVTGLSIILYTVPFFESVFASAGRLPQILEIIVISGLLCFGPFLHRKLFEMCPRAGLIPLFFALLLLSGLWIVFVFPASGLLVIILRFIILFSTAVLAAFTVSLSSMTRSGPALSYQSLALTLGIFCGLPAFKIASFFFDSPDPLRLLFVLNITVCIAVPCCLLFLLLHLFKMKPRITKNTQGPSPALGWIYPLSLIFFIFFTIPLFIENMEAYMYYAAITSEWVVPVYYVIFWFAAVFSALIQFLLSPKIPRRKGISVILTSLLILYPVLYFLPFLSAASGRQVPFFTMVFPGLTLVMGLFYGWLFRNALVLLLKNTRATARSLFSGILIMIVFLMYCLVPILRSFLLSVYHPVILPFACFFITVVLFFFHSNTRKRQHITI